MLPYRLRKGIQGKTSGKSVEPRRETAKKASRVKGAAVLSPFPRKNITSINFFRFRCSQYGGRSVVAKAVQEIDATAGFFLIKKVPSPKVRIHGHSSVCKKAHLTKKSTAPGGHVDVFPQRNASNLLIERYRPIADI